MSVSGVLVDCGSGHISVIAYIKTADGNVHQLAKGWLKHADGGNMQITDVLTSGEHAAFISQLKAIIAEQQTTACFEPIILYCGATGGVREAIEKGTIGSKQVDDFRSVLNKEFGAMMRVIKLEVLTGNQEAAWELEAAQIIWNASSMFPNLASYTESLSIGLFSGGGQSMQLAQVGAAPLSFPFSTFPEELEERKGASPTAWLDPAAWGRFEDGLKSKVSEAAKLHPPFDGCFVGTAMNHRAAMYTQISEQPISAAAAVTALRAALIQFRLQEGPLNERMMADVKEGSSYPLARIAAMHTFRLATVLEALFTPDAMMYFARDGVDVAGQKIDCEWTVGAFMAEAKALRA
jgi:hypothetical protein